MKNLVLGALCVFVLGLSVTAVMARPAKRYDAKTKTCRVLSSGPLEWESLPWGMGGKGFHNVCQSCHTQGEDSKAPFLWTESKSSKGWNRLFADTKVQCANDGSWDAFTEDQLQMVNDYLYSWSSTSLDRNDAA